MNKHLNLDKKIIYLIIIILSVLVIYFTFRCINNKNKDYSINIKHKIVEDCDNKIRILIEENLSEEDRKNIIDYYIRSSIRDSDKNQIHIYLVDKNFKSYKGGVYGEGICNKTFEGVGQYNKIIYLYVQDKQKPSEKDFKISEEYNKYIKKGITNSKYKISKKLSYPLEEIDSSLDKVEYYSRAYVERKNYKKFRASSNFLFFLADKQYKEE